MSGMLLINMQRNKPVELDLENVDFNYQSVMC